MDKTNQLKNVCDIVPVNSVVIIESSKFCSACPQDMRNTINKLSKLTNVFLLTHTSTPLNIRYKLNSYGSSEKNKITPIYFDSLAEQYAQLPSPYYVVVGQREDLLTFTSDFSSSNGVTRHLKKQIKNLKRIKAKSSL